jgi:hypothetical protein
MAEHTPTPWEIDADDPAVIWGPDDLRIASLTGSTIVAGEDNAEHIVRCVNLFDDLVAALEAWLKFIPRVAITARMRPEHDDCVAQTNSALSKARGES